MKIIPKTISESEFLDKIKNIKDQKIKMAFMLGFYQCMRVSEIIHLTKENIDIERGFINIKQSKGKKDRDIPIMQPVIKYLRYLPLKCTRQALHKQIKKYFPNCHMHTLRHSGATYYLNEKNIGIRQLQQLLGHSRLDTTQIYTHITPQNLKKSFENIW